MKKLMTKNICKLLLPTVAAGAMLCASSACAQLVSEGVGGTAFFTGLTGQVAATGVGGGTLQASTSGSYAFGTGDIDTGTLASYVYSGDANNTLGGLTFIYVLTVTTGDIQSLEVSSANWGSSVALGYGTSSTAGVLAPVINAPLSGAYTVSGSVDFTYDPNVVAGTYYMVVGTALTSYQLDPTTLIDSSPDGALSEYGPAPVPEASTIMAGALMILPLGIGAFRTLRKERMA